MTNVSVIIPCTDRIVGLKRCITSALNQEFSGEIEVVLIENNSRDRSLVIGLVKEFNDERIKHFYLEKCSNANVARNFGAARAEGEYVAFLDSDDEWLPLHIHRALYRLEESDAVSSNFNCISERSTSEITGAINGSVEDSLIVKKTVDIRSSTLVIKKDCFNEVMFDERLNKHQDWGFSIDFSKRFRIVKADFSTVNIYVDSSERMSSRINLEASLYFCDNKLSSDKSRGVFLLSRATESMYRNDYSAFVRFVSEAKSYGFHENATGKRKLAAYTYMLLEKIPMFFNLACVASRLYLTMFVINR